MSIDCNENKLLYNINGKKLDEKELIANSRNVNTISKYVGALYINAKDNNDLFIKLIKAKPIKF